MYRTNRESRPADFGPFESDGIHPTGAQLSPAVVVKAGAARPDISSAEKFRDAMLAARSVVHATPGQTPSGTHMGKVMEQLGIADAMAKKVLTCRHCSLAIERDDIVVVFFGADAIHVRCWPVNGTNGSHHESIAPPARKAAASPPKRRRATRNAAA